MTDRAGPWPNGDNVMGPACAQEQIGVVAHRGDSGNFPENTAAAFCSAVSLGVACVEFDVHYSQDGELIVIHDASVDRTSDGSGDVFDLSLSQIKQFDAGAWFGDEFSGERFLTLDEALDELPAPLRLNVHVKATPATRQPVTSKTVETLVYRQLLDRAYLAADEPTLTIARTICPGIEICNLSVNPPGDYVSRSAAIGCRILQPGHAITTPALVEDAHAHEMLVFAFFADEPEQMQRLLDCGVDGMLTNQPQRLQTLLENQ